MAVNIEMNYFNGTEYIGLRPLASVDSSSGVLKQILEYIGTGENQITQSLIYERPKCIIRLSGNYFVFGAFDGGRTMINCFHMGGENVIVGFVTFEAYWTTGPVIVIRNQSVIDNYPAYFVRINVPINNGNVTGQGFQEETNIKWFNSNGSNYTFLILY